MINNIFGLLLTGDGIAVFTLVFLEQPSWLLVQLLLCRDAQE
jgi:hypothetical protein